MHRLRLLHAATIASLATGAAHADTWNLQRHDPQRTASASGSVSLVTPTVGWRNYVGAPVSASAGAFDPNDSTVFFSVSGGKLVARRITTQQVLWQSQLLGITTLAGAADLDGDGKSEVVAFDPKEALILSGASGAVLWRSSQVEYGYVADVRLADLNRDGKTDVLIDECGSCAKVGTLLAGAYSFASGFTLPQTLWTLASGGPKPGYHSGTDTVVNLDDTSTQLVLSYGDEVRVLKGSTGTLLASLTIPNAGKFTFTHVPSLAAQLDGAGGREVLVVTPSASADAERSIAAFRVDATSGTSSLMWRASFPDAGAVSMPADLASDLDGDGADEVILSGYTSSKWTTKILDGKTGTVRFEVAGARFEGTANLDGIAGAELVTAAADGLSVYAIRSGTLVRIAGPLAGYRAVPVTDPLMRARGPINGRIATTPNGLAIGVPHNKGTVSDSINGPGAFDSIAFAAVSATGFQLGSTYTPGVGRVTDMFLINGSTRPYLQLAAGTSFGALEVLDGSLHVTNLASATGEVNIGTLVGGTTALPAPLVSKDASGPFVVITSPTASRSIVDARDASLIVAPKSRWETDLGFASIVDFGGTVGVQVVSLDTYDLVARRTVDGVVTKRVALGSGGSRTNFTLAPLRVAGRTEPLIGVDWEVTSGQVVQKGVDLTAGSILWNGTAISYGGFFSSTVADLNGDGTDEWYAMAGGLSVRQANDGSAVKVPSIDTGYSAPIAADFLGDGKLELLHQSGTELQLMRADQSVAWKAAYVEPANGRFGTRASCSTGSVFVTPSVQSPWLRWYNGKTGAQTDAKVAAGGLLFDSVDAATKAGKTPGELSNVSSVADMSGKGPAIFVGSTDGYLYAIDACTKSLVWAFDLGAPVSDPVIANEDDDLDNEILVTTSNGFIHVLDVPRCEGASAILLNGQSAPQKVVAGANTTVSWTGVAAASKYDVGLINSDNFTVWTPPFRTATSTSFTFNTDGLRANRAYRVVVRPIGQAGACAETFSSDFTVTDDIPPTGALAASFNGSNLTVHVTANDNLALDRYTLGWRLPGETKLNPLRDELITGTSKTADVAFTVPDTSKGIELVLDVFDSANLTAHVALVASPGGPPQPPGDGCDCTTASTPSASRFGEIAALLLITAGFVRRGGRASLPRAPRAKRS